MRFEPGGPPPTGVIPLCVPEIRGNEWHYVKECLDTNWVSSVGSFVDRLERMVAEYVGSAHAVATVNGTAALHIALRVAGVEPGDEVVVSTLTFIAPANAIRYVGAWPVFIDAEPDYWQMDPRIVESFLAEECNQSGGVLRNNATGRRVKALLPVHILGHPCDMQSLSNLARKYELVVIEDATESLGAKCRGEMVGHLGDVACFSFNGNKIITTGGGGMIVTDCEAFATRSRYLTTQAKDDPVEYIHGDIGYNYRLTNIQAAMGVAQMEDIDDRIAAKRRIAARYSEAFVSVPGLVPQAEASWSRSSRWMYTVRVDDMESGIQSRELMTALAAQGIQSRPLWMPIHRATPYRESPAYGVDVSDALYRECLSLPCSVGLSNEEQQRVIEAVVGEACAQRH